MRLQQLLAFLEQNPSDSFLRFAIAKEHEKTGNTTEALGFYQKIVADDPAYVGVYYHLGKLLEKSGDIAAALTAYRTGMDMAQQAGDRHALSELAGAKLELED